MEIKIDYEKFKKLLEGSKLVDEVDSDYVIQKTSTGAFYRIDGKNINMYSSSDGIAVGTKDYSKSVLSLEYSIEKVERYPKYVAKNCYAPDMSKPIKVD